MLKANGRTLIFKDLFFPVPGYGYRLRLYTDAGMLSTETEPFDIWDTASKAEFIRQPGEAMAGEALRNQPVLHYLDQFNNPVTTFEPNVLVSIGTAQRWDEALNNGLGGWQDLAGTDKPILSGLLSMKAEGGVVQFSDLTVDRAVERLTLLTSACLTGPSGVREGACVEKESIAFAVAAAVQSLQLESGSLPTSVKAGYITHAKILLYNGDTSVSPSTSTVDVSAVNAADNTNPVKGKVAVAASNGEALFSEFYFDAVGVMNVTFKVELAGQVLAMVQQSIFVEAGEPVSIVVRNNNVNFNELQAGQAFLVELEILDKFGNRNLSPALTPIARAPQGSNYQLFIGTTSNAPNLIQNKTVDGIVMFNLRVDLADEVTVKFLWLCRLQSTALYRKFTMRLLQTARLMRVVCNTVSRRILFLMQAPAWTSRFVPTSPCPSGAHMHASVPQASVRAGARRVLLQHLWTCDCMHRLQAAR